MASQADLRQEVHRFFDAFVSAFAKFDGDLIAERYAAPYLSIGGAGAARVFARHTDIGQYFQGIVDEYHAQGCRACRHEQLEITPIGQNSALASVTWALLREDGSVVSGWRESYNLTRLDGVFRIHVSTDHAE